MSQKHDNQAQPIRNRQRCRSEMFLSETGESWTDRKLAFDTHVNITHDQLIPSPEIHPQERDPALRKQSAQAKFTGFDRRNIEKTSSSSPQLF